MCLLVRHPAVFVRRIPSRLLGVLNQSCLTHDRLFYFCQIAPGLLTQFNADIDNFSLNSIGSTVALFALFQSLARATSLNRVHALKKSSLVILGSGKSIWAILIPLLTPICNGFKQLSHNVFNMAKTCVHIQWAIIR